MKRGPPPHPASQINGYLADAPNIFIDKRSKPLCDVPEMGIGNKPIDGGNYLFTSEERDAFLEKEPGAAPYFRQWMGARELLYGEKRYCLWSGDAEPSELKKLPCCMERIERVRSYRAASKSAPMRAIASNPRRFHVENMPRGTYLAVLKVSSGLRSYVLLHFVPHTSYLITPVSYRLKVTAHHEAFNLFGTDVVGWGKLINSACNTGGNGYHGGTWGIRHLSHISTVTLGASSGRRSWGSVLCAGYMVLAVGNWRYTFW